MPKNKMTPGPWKVNNNIGKKSEIGVIADSAPCIIAIMGNAIEWPVESRANAQVIAAVPDLIEALELITRHCIYMNNMQHAGQEMLDIDWATLYSLQNTAKAALEKAGIR